ncbi:MAG: alpha/beta fold hydrolase, partial [Gemmatimonadota bacterium]|nr:alpha/beta fold hydrolase [Gemmatimonadota bacterium]
RRVTEVSSKSPEAFEIPCADGLFIRGEVYPADSPLGSVIVCHGFKGFAHWAFFPFLARSLADAGLTAITFDFSGSGIGPDRETFTQPDAFAENTFSREQDDIANVVDYARRKKLLNGKFGLFGHSRGGAMAILYAAAQEAEVKSLVTWAAIGRTNWWTPEEAITWRTRGYAEVVNSRTGQVMRIGTDLLDDVELHGTTKLNIAAAAAKIKVPWLIVHGTGDETVRSTDAERLHALSLGVSTLRLIEGANHGFDAKHPLGEAPPVLQQVVRDTVKFFVRNATQ